MPTILTKPPRGMDFRPYSVSPTRRDHTVLPNPTKNWVTLPPKRFAQAIGLAFSTTAAVLALVLDLHLAAAAVLGVLVLFATLEAALGFCAGCWAFGHLMRLGVVAEETCEACADISKRRQAVST